MSDLYAGMVHGDLKPENVVVAVPHVERDPNDYVLKFIDFGYSSLEDDVSHRT